MMELGHITLINIVAFSIHFTMVLRARSGRGLLVNPGSPYVYQKLQKNMEKVAKK